MKVLVEGVELEEVAGLEVRTRPGERVVIVRNPQPDGSERISLYRDGDLAEPFPVAVPTEQPYWRQAPSRGSGEAVASVYGPRNSGGV